MVAIVIKSQQYELFINKLIRLYIIEDRVEILTQLFFYLDLLRILTDNVFFPCKYVLSSMLSSLRQTLRSYFSTNDLRYNCATQFTILLNLFFRSKM